MRRYDGHRLRKFRFLGAQLQLVGYRTIYADVSGRAPAWGLSNNATGSGTSTGGEADYATQATISGSKDGHIVMIGGSGVHISGPVDFDNNVNMASHRINNLAAGVAGTDAVNLDQLNAAIKAAGDNPYVVTNTGTYAAATPAKAGGSGTAIGANANASGISAVALGGNTTATGQNALAIGTLSRATAAETVAVGVSANAQAVNSTALGRGAASTAPTRSRSVTDRWRIARTAYPSVRGRCNVRSRTWQPVRRIRTP